MLSVGLRGGALSSKFLLIFMLAKYLQPNELGIYGLVVATIAYAMYPLGFEFYTFSTRELLRRPREEWGGIIRSQISLHFMLYVLVLPVMLLLFLFEFLPWYVMAWFYVLVILEHLNQELMRLLVAISEQLTASFTLFVRQGLWALLVSVWMYANPDDRNLIVVFSAWSLGALAAMLIGVVKLYSLQLQGWRCKVGWGWLKAGLKVAVPILISSLFLRAVFTLDRYWLDSLQGSDLLGVYVFFIAVSSALIAFLDAGVFSFSYPGMISAYNRNDSNAYKLIVKKMVWLVVIATTLFCIAVVSLMPYVLDLIDRDLYSQNIDILFILLLAMVFQAFSNIPHYCLYSQSRDRPIVLSNIFSLVVFVSVVLVLLKFTTLYAVPLGLCITLFVLLILKAIACYKLTPVEYK